MPEVSIDSCKKEVLIGYIGILYRKFKERFPNEPINFTEVKHGEWKLKYEPNGWSEKPCAECSECGEDFCLDDYNFKDFKELFFFCPNCGADLRTEGER